MKKNILPSILSHFFIILFVFAFSFSSWGQTQIWYEDFEDATVGYTTSTVEFTDNGEDYFTRTDGSNIASAMVYIGPIGTSYFAASDMDGDGNPSTITMSVDNINISTYSSLVFKVYIAEDDDGSNEDWDGGTALHFDYDIDNSGTFSPLIWVENSTNGTNDAPFIDTDFDGTGDGAEITPTFVQYTASIPGAGSLLDLLITFANLKNGDEDVAIDHIEIYGTSGSPTPTIIISSSSLTGFTYLEGSGPSGEQSFDVEGSNLTNDITVTPVGNWEISTVSGGPYQTTAITLAESGGSVSSTAIYTQMISGLTNAGSPYSENIACESTGATAKNVAVDGTVTVVSSNCGSETFTNSNAAASYSDNSYTGDNSVTWSYIESRDENGDANGSGINGNALMLRDLGNGSKVVSSSVSGGIGDFTCKLYKGFTGAGNRQVELYVNGISQGTSTIFDDYNEHVFTVNGINISGNVTVELRNITSKQIIVDDIEWTCYAAIPAPEIQVQIPVGTDVACGDTYDFGTIVFGNNSNEILRIQNTGTADLDITSFPLTTEAEYGISPASTGTTVAASGNYDITVTYTPSGAGTFTDAITINNDDSDEGTCVINFTGVGVVCNTPTTESNTMTFTSVGSSSMTVNWNNGDGANRIVVAKEASAVTGNPVDGTTYTASATFGSGDILNANEYVVYNGSGSSFTVNGLSASTIYYFEVFEYNCTSGNEIYYTGTTLTGNETTTVTPVAAVLTQGDLAVMGVCSNTSACVGGTSGGDDEISFVCFKDITTGTEIDMTDNGWERCHANQWGNAEGYLRITRTGSTIPAGTVITIRTHGSGVELEGVYPDNDWSIDIIGGFARLILNSDGDQIYFMQDGLWADGTSGDNDATYTGGEILFGFNTNDSWTSGICSVANSSSGNGRSQNSGLIGGMDCFNMIPSGATDYLKYTGPQTPASQIEWVGRLNDNLNWSSYADCAAYYAGTPNYETGHTISITVSGIGATYQWYGNKNTEWFECANWGPMRVPTAAHDVSMPNSVQVANDIVLLAGENAECKTFTVEDPNHTIKGENGSTKRLTVYGDITIDGGSMDFDDGNNTTTDGSIYITGDWINNNATADFIPGNSTIYFNGNTTQNITSNDGLENFGNVQITGSTVLVSNNNNLNIYGNWTNYAHTGFTEGTSNVAFIGSSNQNINTIGGEIFYNAEINNSTTVTMSNNLTVSNQLNQEQGELVINGKSLTLQSDLIRTSGTFTGSSSSNMIINGSGNLATSLYFTSGSESLNNLTINRSSSGTVTIATNLTIYGQLGMSSGELDINDQVLTLNGTISGVGFLKGSAASDLVIGGSGSLGTMNFSVGSREVENLTTNRASGISTLGTDLSVNTLFTLTNGIITTGNNLLIVTNPDPNAIINHSINSYVYGYLRRYVNPTGSYDFPIGHFDAAHPYNPSSYEYVLGNINLNSSTGINYLTSNFNTHTTPIDISALALTVNGTPLGELLNFGYWTIHPDNNTYTVDYDVTISSDGHTNGGSDAAQHTVIKRVDDSVDWVANQGTHDNATQTIVGSVITAKRTALSGFSDFAIARNTIHPLPITLLFVKAKHKSQNVLIQWATSSEFNNDYFTIERTSDFIYVEEVARQFGMGNSNSIQEYSSEDLSPLKETSYYRIKQTDFDGETSYSDWVKVESNEEGSPFFAFFDNDSRTLKLTLNNNKALIRISNIQAKVIYESEKKEGSSKFNIKLGDYNIKTGIYLVTIISASKTETKKFFVD